MISEHLIPEKPPLAKAARLMNKARDAFYDRRYEESVERCQETLEALLPPVDGSSPQTAPPTPDDLAVRFGAPLPELSMGMTGDLEAAIAEGSTMVRVGSALYGARE